MDAALNAGERGRKWAGDSTLAHWACLGTSVAGRSGEYRSARQVNAL